MSNDFTAKRVLVTGGNSGIGLATARRFAESGATVAITGRDRATLDTAAADIGHNVLAVASDAGNLDDIRALVDQLKNDWGTLDVLVINAGVAKFGPLAALDETAWDESFDVNVKGPYFLIQQAAELMPSGSTIVLNGSVNAHIGMAGSTIYAASKAALVSLARTLSTELLDQGIRVNVVSPGPVTTPLHERLGMSDDQLAAFAENVQAQVPLGRFGQPDEVTDAIVFLAGSTSSFVVGSELIIDGGMITL